MYKIEQLAGERQLMVLFVSDGGDQVDPEDVLDDVATDAAQRERKGWQLISVGAMPLRQMGTAGNVLFQSGGQYTTQVAVMAIYRLAD